MTNAQMLVLVIGVGLMMQIAAMTVKVVELQICQEKETK